MAYRKEKLEELIRRVVSELIMKDIKDPRIGFVTITGVDLSKDFSVAKIGISIIGTPRDLRKTLEGLNSAIGYIQHKVGKSIRIKSIPRIEFFLDASVSQGVEMVNLIDSLNEDNDSDEKTDVVGIED